MQDNIKQEKIKQLNDYIDLIIKADSNSLDTLLNEIKEYIYNDKFLNFEYFKKVGHHQKKLKKRKTKQLFENFFTNIASLLLQTGFTLKYGFWGVDEKSRMSLFYPAFGVSSLFESAKKNLSFALSQADADGILVLYYKIILGYLAECEAIENNEMIRGLKNKLSEATKPLFYEMLETIDFYLLEKENNIVSTNTQDSFCLYMCKTASLKVLSDLVVLVKLEKTEPKHLISLTFKKSKIQKCVRFLASGRELEFNPTELKYFISILKEKPEKLNEKTLYNIVSDINNVSRDITGFAILVSKGNGIYVVDENLFNIKLDNIEL